MTDRTLTSLYASRDDAERARNDLTGAGVSGVDLHDKATHGEGFMDKVKSFFGGHDDAHAYNEGVSRGHTLLTANVPDEHTDNAARILEGSNAVDLDREQEAWRNGGWTGGASASARAGEEQVIPIVEERLVVGKREVERGGVRVRSYVVETPVSESIGLREEHVSIERRPVDRAVNAGDASFQDREIALTETAEEAVVAKDAFVREELVVRKDASERTEEIRDTVRHTEVEVDDTTGGRRVRTDEGTSRSV